MLKELISLANHFDSKGLTKEADFVDRLISKASLDDEEIEGMFDTPPKKVEYEKNPDFTDEENINNHIGKLAVNYIGRKHDKEDGLLAMKKLEEFVLEACKGMPCEVNVKAKSKERSGEEIHHEESGIGMTYHYHFNPENKLQEILHNCIMEILDRSDLYDLGHNAVEFGENIMNHVEEKSNSDTEVGMF